MTETSTVDHLASHLKGIDTRLTTYPSTWYWADTSFYVKTVSVAADRYKLLTPNAIQIDIGGSSYTLSAQATLDLSQETTWDTVSGTDYRTASNRAGKDFYIYAVQPVSGTAPSFKVSINSTTPTNYTAGNSRKVGGFHCLCVAAGTISGHPATGYAQGDIIPNSVWDLKWRSAGTQAGMAYVSGRGNWQGIYLQSGTSTSTTSAYGGTIMDTRMYYDHLDDLAAIGCVPQTDADFQISAEGSNQQTNISTSADPVTTGGHTDTAGRRMISNYFLEDCCGAMWQWLQEQTYQPGSGVAGWKDVFPDADKGQLYLLADNAEVRVIAGGGWSSGVYCGSRSRILDHYSWFRGGSIGARGVASHISK